MNQILNTKARRNEDHEERALDRRGLWMRGVFCHRATATQRYSQRTDTAQSNTPPPSPPNSKFQIPNSHLPISNSPSLPASRLCEILCASVALWQKAPPTRDATFDRSAPLRGPSQLRGFVFRVCVHSCSCVAVYPPFPHATRRFFWPAASRLRRSCRKASTAPSSGLRCVRFFISLRARWDSVSSRDPSMYASSTAG